MAKVVESSPTCQTGCSAKGCKMGLFLFHTLLTTVYAFAVYRTYLGPPIPVAKPQGEILGPLKYLTVWDLHFQLLASALNLMVVLTSCKKLASLRNAVHHGLSFPYGLTVFLLFWSLYVIDRRLVFPKELDEVIPPFVNHILHTLVGISPLINEMLTYNQRKSSHFFIYLSVFVAYLSQVLIVGYYFDYWIYPILEVLSDSSRFVFLSFCIILGVIIYLTHGALHSFIWNKQIKDSKKKKN